nr:hypothetical protein [Lachnospiraceae bacterium]
MLKVFIYLWVICVTFGPAYNIVGDPGVFALMFAIILWKRKLNYDIKLTTSVVLFAILIAYKAVGVDNSQAIAEFHSAYGVINTSLKLIFFVLFFQTSIFVIKIYRKNVSNIFFV